MLRKSICSCLFIIETYTLPVHWASYFVNADPSRLDDSDLDAANGWWAVTFGAQSVTCTDVSEEHHFTKYHDADRWSLASDAAVFSFLIHNPVRQILPDRAANPTITT
jgi:hypothetical protein